MDNILSFVRDAALIAFKVFIKALAQHLTKRLKDRTVLTRNKDGSDALK